MFSGIVRSTGRVVAARARAGGGRRVEVATRLSLGELPIGGSVAVDGVCLTVVARGRRGGARWFAADLGPETLRRSTLAGLRAGAAVNLEPPLRLGDPLHGHLVQGHVDGVGTVRRARAARGGRTLEIAAPAAARPYLAHKSSVAVDGVSLTVNALRGRVFSVTLVPHTLALTTLGRRAAGDRVNIEADALAKHLHRLFGRRARQRRRPAPSRG